MVRIVNTRLFFPGFHPLLSLGHSHTTVKRMLIQPFHWHHYHFKSFLFFPYNLWEISQFTIHYVQLPNSLIFYYDPIDFEDFFTLDKVIFTLRCHSFFISFFSRNIYFVSLDFALDLCCQMFWIAWLQLRLSRGNKAFDFVCHNLFPAWFYLLLFNRLVVPQWVFLFHLFLIMPFHFLIFY